MSTADTPLSQHEPAFPQSSLILPSAAYSFLSTCGSAPSHAPPHTQMSIWGMLFAPASSTGAVPFHYEFICQMKFCDKYSRSSASERPMLQVRQSRDNAKLDCLHPAQLFAIKHKKGKMCLPLLLFHPSQVLILLMRCRSSFWVSLQSLICYAQPYKKAF